MKIIYVHCGEETRYKQQVIYRLEVVTDVFA